MSIRKVACDIGPSINLVSSSILRNNKGVQVKSSNVTPTLYDKTIKHPLELVEDVVVADKTFVTSDTQKNVHLQKSVFLFYKKEGH